MSRLLALPVAWLAACGAIVKRDRDLQAAQHRAHEQAVMAELCREYCWSSSTRRRRCDCA